MSAEASTADERLPIAVYGTLRVGHGNHRLVAGRTSDIVSGVVHSHELVVDGLPFARPSTVGGLLVEVVWPVSELYDDVLAELDRLEGFRPDHGDSFYVRREVLVSTEQGDVRAWLYEAGERARRSLRLHPRVESGDYTDVRPLAGEAVA